MFFQVRMRCYHKAICYYWLTDGYLQGSPAKFIESVGMHPALLQDPLHLAGVPVGCCRGQGFTGVHLTEDHSRSRAVFLPVQWEITLVTVKLNTARLLSPISDVNKPNDVTKRVQEDNYRASDSNRLTLVPH